MDETGNRKPSLADLNARIGERIVIDPVSVADRAPGAGASDPGTDSGGTDTGSPRINRDGTIAKKRGRKPGSAAQPQKINKAGVSVSGLESLLLSIHNMAAVAIDSKAMQLSKEEATSLAEGIVGVTSYYNVAASQETLIWTNLIVALFAIYGPRAVIVWNEKTKDKKKAPKHQAPTEAIIASEAPALKPDVIDPDVFQHAAAAG